jgi:hypothetical protein
MEATDQVSSRSTVDRPVCVRCVEIQGRTATAEVGGFDYAAGDAVETILELLRQAWPGRSPLRDRTLRDFCATAGNL